MYRIVDGTLLHTEATNCDQLRRVAAALLFRLFLAQALDEVPQHGQRPGNDGDVALDDGPLDEVAEADEVVGGRGVGRAVLQPDDGGDGREDTEAEDEGHSDLHLDGHLQPPQDGDGQQRDGPVGGDVEPRHDVRQRDEHVDVHALARHLAPRRRERSALDPDADEGDERRQDGHDDDAVQEVGVPPLYRESDQGRADARLDEYGAAHVEDLPQGDHLELTVRK